MRACDQIHWRKICWSYLFVLTKSPAIRREIPVNPWIYKIISAAKGNNMWFCVFIIWKSVHDSVAYSNVNVHGDEHEWMVAIGRLKTATATEEETREVCTWTHMKWLLCTMWRWFLCFFFFLFPLFCQGISFIIIKIFHLWNYDIAYQETWASRTIRTE